MTTAMFRTELAKLDDRGEIQLVDLLGHTNERLEQVLRVASHGFTSSAPVGSHGVGLRLRGVSDLAVALGLEHPTHRPRNLPGGAAVLYDSSGNVVRAYTKDGIQIEAKDGHIWAKPAIGKKVFLGGDGKQGSYAAVMTGQGPSINVYARVG